MMTQPGWKESRRIRFHGDHGPSVITLHGGPAAFGGAVHLAQGLSKEFQVVEPWQRSSGDSVRPLTVAIHIEDLHNLILSRFNGEKPALVGSSWGAMLALAYAAKHSDSINAIVLVGCGTFDKASRNVIVQRRKQKITDYISKHPEHKADLQLDIGAQMMKWHGMTDAYEPLAIDNDLPESEPFDMQGHTETWQDMVRCQEAGIYPQSFSSVKVPVIMLHGADDPHPGTMIRDTLKRYIPHLGYHEFPQCGHDPEIEKYAKDDFFAVLSNWLKRHLPSTNGAQQCHRSDA
ncbi:MAG: alpha/beta hydrolase [Smithella sp.]|jgi:pimeloyl-ACP methyl ester carboxylesterase